MNSFERVMNRLEGKPVDKIPNASIIMQFAARRIGVEYDKYCLDYNLLVDGNLRCCEDFGLDFVCTLSDAAREASAFGADIIMGRDSVPALGKPLIEEYADIKNLTCKKAADAPRMLDRVMAVARYSREVKGIYPIIGWVEAPFAEAADLRGVNNIMMDVIDEPEFVKELMDITLCQGISFAREQVDAGADIIGIGDAVASLVGPAIYEEIVLPYEIKLLKSLKEMGVKTKLHICGNIEPCLALLPVDYCDIIDLDSMVSVKKAIELHPKTTFDGNVNPVDILYKSPEELTKIVQDVLALGNEYYMFSAGCEIPRDTPHLNMALISKLL